MGEMCRSWGNHPPALAAPSLLGFVLGGMLTSAGVGAPDGLVPEGRVPPLLVNDQGILDENAIGNYPNDHHYPGFDMPLAPNGIRFLIYLVPSLMKGIAFFLHIVFPELFTSPT